METDGALERNQVFHQSSADLPMIQSTAVDAQRLGDYLETVRRRGVVECHDMLHQHRVAQPMGQVQKAPQAVGHGVHGTENGIGERQPGLHAAEHDLFPQGDVARVSDHLHQVAVDQPHRLQRMGVGERAMTGGDESLDSVHQRVDARTGRQERVHAQCGFRVDQRDVRHGGLADNGKLHALLLVGDDHELRDIGRSSGSGGNQDQRWAGHMQGVDAFELEDIAAMGDDDPDGFAAVHGTAATDCDDDVTVVFPVQLGTEHHFLDPGIGRNVAVDAVIDTQGLET